MSTYSERVEIGVGTRIVLAAIGVLALAVCGVWITVGFRQTWFLLLASGAVAYYCIARSLRGYHLVTRDDGES